MPIVPMSALLEQAKEEKYAVGCFNSIDLAMTRGIIQAAEAENSPVILCHAEVHFKYTPLTSVMPILLEEAGNAKVPVALLLDHGKEFQAMVQAMHLGMNSIMFDGSELDYETNVARTKEIVKIAQALHVTVEGEIGRVVRPANGGADGTDDAALADREDLYTDPDEAAAYVRETGLDALACAFGTVHGVYRKEPRLDFTRLRAIAEKTGVPIVMHGGSGLGREDFQKAIQNGVTKINYYTNLALYVGRQIKAQLERVDEPFYHHITGWAQQAVCEDTRKAIRIFRGL